MLLGKAKRFMAIAMAAVLTVGMSAYVPTNSVKASTEDNTFRVLSINVAGLPALISSGNPSENTSKISPLLDNYDIVHVQEDFAYHSQLVAQVNELTYQTSHSGNVPVGDGMNCLSRYPLHLTQRYKWNDTYGFITNGADQMTPKGILYNRVEIEPGVMIDIYNIHTDADTDEGSLAARRSNMNQLAALIKERSEGMAVIVFGDTNSRYTRSGDNFEEAVLETCGLTDAWVELLCDGVAPEDDDENALFDWDNMNSANHEVVDKIWYRSGRNVDLQAIHYELLETEFTDDNGEQLSDHYPVTATFKYTVNEAVLVTDTYGGGGGTGFSFLDKMNYELPESIELRSGNRVDGITFHYPSDTATIGGNGGTLKSYTFLEGEYIMSMTVCKAKKSAFGTYRISYVKFVTNLGNVIEGGKYDSKNNQTYTAPDGYAIAGIQGHAGDEIDRIGCIYLKVR